jgi:thiol:disulfide interchange protein DsbD
MVSRMRRPSVLALLVGLAVIAVPVLAFAQPSAGDATLDEYRGWGLVALYGTAFTAGLAASLTPCVYPMIPIVLGVFGARGRSVSRGKSLVLASLYVFGMGVTYAALGTIFTLLGKQFSAVLAEPAVVIPIVLLYIVLALSMFGAFDLNLPASWQAKLNKVGGAGYSGAFAMGLVGGFTAAPCTGPFVAGLLTAVAKTGDVGIGASTLFVHAMGIGVLYWVLAVFAGNLPKSGRWMEWVKSAGGIGLLVAALYFLRPIVPGLREIASPAWWFLFGALAIAIVGLVGGAIHLSFHDSVAIKARKAVAAMLVVIGSYAAVAWLLTPKRHLPWVYDETVAFERARVEGKGVMVDFSATWCTPCEELELTFAEDGVYEQLVDNFVPLKFDVTKDTSVDSERRKRYRAPSLPAVIFMSPDGAVLARIDQKTEDYLEGDGFLRAARPAIDEIKRRRPTISSTMPTSP